ncbi:MAG: hypothetical protein LBS60_02370 [Deltaproteobacteria bacterium]|jgi:hypothetical protein|nr:hypothetical protein [Deltaproteobacteria bacterium]
MAKKITLTPEELDRAARLVHNSTELRDYRRGVIALLMADNRYTGKELAARLGITERSVFNELAKIRNPELKARGEWGGARTNLMSFPEEEAFLGEYIEMAKRGIILTIPILHDEFNKRVGKTVPKSTFYRILQRHDWRKVKSDTINHHLVPKTPEELKKKGSRHQWVKPTKNGFIVVFPQA